jgi:LysR family transcriptional regulator (chromosome initiation inhibitor)
VTSLQKPVQGCRVAALGALRYRATASPAYIERYLANGVTPASLAGAPALTFNQKDTLQQAWLRQVFDLSVTVPTHWLPSTQSFVDASLAGMGWGMNPEQLVSAQLRSGRLVELVPGTPLDVLLYWQASRLAADRLGDLTRAVVSHARQTLVAVA